MYRILICLICQIAIPPDHIARHAARSDHHHDCKITKEQVTLLKGTYNLFPGNDLVPPRGHTAPITGLSLRSGGFQCQICGHVVLSCFFHMPQDHPGQTENKVWETNCFYQQLFLDRRRYFRVYPATDTRGTDELFGSYILNAKVALETTADLLPVVTNNRNQTKTWLETSGWPRAVEGYQWELLVDMVSFSKHDPISSVLQRACQRFVNDMAEAAQNSNSEIRRWLLSCTKYVLVSPD